MSFRLLIAKGKTLIASNRQQASRICLLTIICHLSQFHYLTLKLNNGSQTGLINNYPKSLKLLLQIKRN